MSDIFEIPLVLPKSTRSSLEIKTGDWRTLKPEFDSKNSACEANCPIRNKTREWLGLVKDGKFKEAWRVLIKTNPLPAVLGKVCPRFCENKCLRKDFDEALEINFLEGFLGELALKKKWQPEEPPLSYQYIGVTKKIAVVGAGPAGLACAYQLRRKGHIVTIFEAENAPGGMLYWGIPGCRLPKKLLFKEIENNIFSLGRINIKCGSEFKVDALKLRDFSLRYDAVVVATGRMKSRKLDISGEEYRNVIFGLDFLKKINLGEKVDIGKVVAVIGGGNTAIDAARLAKRNGAEKVSIFYRRREEDMPAFESEIKSAKEEGVEIITLVAPLEIKKIREEDLLLKYASVEFGEIDETGRPKLIICRDKTDKCFFDNIIIAAGEEPDLNFHGHYEEGFPENVFFAGDIIKENGGTVAAAIGSGNKTAEEIDFYLRNGRYCNEEKNKSSEKKVVDSANINTVYFKKSKRLFGKKAKKEEGARKEAGRCFSCGLCNSCGNCWIFCPDVAVLEKDNKYEINYDYCKGCGICANECPRNVINMELEVKS